MRTPHSKYLRRCSLTLIALSVGFLTQFSAPVVQASTAVAHVAVMMYHYVDQAPAGNDSNSVTRRLLTVTPKNFDEQMAWIKAHGYVTVSASQVVQALTQNKPLPAHSVMLSFDDGYEDAYTTVFPTLRKYGLIGTFFVVTDWIDAGKSGYLNWAQVKQMADAGMSIEAHTRDHKALISTDMAWLTNEINGSATDIQAHLGVRPTMLAYPGGNYDGNALLVARQSGIKVAFTTSYGIANAYNNMLTEPRVRVRFATSLAEYAAAVHWSDYWQPLIASVPAS